MSTIIIICIIINIPAAAPPLTNLGPLHPGSWQIPRAQQCADHSDISQWKPSARCHDKDNSV